MTHACKRLIPSSENLDLCASLLRDEAVVAVPTETVYGLAGNALNQASIRKIFDVKGRPLIDPLIVHFPSIKDAEKHVLFNQKARDLAKDFWPGALTMVLPKRDTISDLVTAGLPSVAVRVPGHSVFRSLLERLDFPLAAPSANPFGYVSPTLAEHVETTLGNRILAVLDGGPCEHGVESTIVDLRDPDAPKILRPGPISAEELGLEVSNTPSALDREAQAAPGMLTQHYSPHTAICLFEHGARPNDTTENRAIVFGSKPKADSIPHHFWLSESGDLSEIAHNLFMLLQKLDRAGYEKICVECAKQEGVGIAINDRLSRAAAKSQ